MDVNKRVVEDVDPYGVIFFVPFVWFGEPPLDVNKRVVEDVDPYGVIFLCREMPLKNVSR